MYGALKGENDNCSFKFTSEDSLQIRKFSQKVKGAFALSNQIINLPDQRRINYASIQLRIFFCLPSGTKFSMPYNSAVLLGSCSKHWACWVSSGSDIQQPCRYWKNRQLSKLAQSLPNGHTSYQRYWRQSWLHQQNIEWQTKKAAVRKGAIKRQLVVIMS